LGKKKKGRKKPTRSLTSTLRLAEKPGWRKETLAPRSAGEHEKKNADGRERDIKKKEKPHGEGSISDPAQERGEISASVPLLDPGWGEATHALKRRKPPPPQKKKRKSDGQAGTISSLVSEKGKHDPIQTFWKGGRNYESTSFGPPTKEKRDKIVWLMLCSSYPGEEGGSDTSGNLEKGKGPQIRLLSLVRASREAGGAGRGDASSSDDPRRRRERALPRWKPCQEGGRKADKYPFRCNSVA